MAVAQIGPRDVEGEDNRVGAQHGHQLHPVAEEEHEGGDRAGLDQRRAQREQDALDRVGAVDGERRQRLGGVVDPVEAPEHRPGVEPSVQQVFGGVVEQEERRSVNPETATAQPGAAARMSARPSNQTCIASKSSVARASFETRRGATPIMTAWLRTAIR